MKKMIIMLTAIISLLFWTSAVLAKDSTYDKPWKRFNVSLGANRIANDSKVRLGGEGIGVEIDPEKVLGLDASTTTFRLDGFWRFTKKRRHRLDFTYYRNNRSGETIIDEVIEIPDTPPIPVGAKVETTFNFDLYRVGYSYSFFQDDRMDLGIGGGLYVMPIEFSLKASAGVSGTIVDESVKETFSAPLPVITLRAAFAITDRWQLRTKGDVFYLEIGDYRGGIVDTSVAVEYQPFKHVGFGLAWNNFRLAAEAKDDNNDIPGASFKGTFKFQNAGLMLYLKTNF